MQLSSGAFRQGSTIPEQYTCKGKNISPALEWTGIPEGTKSFALIAEDPDAPVGTYTHWIAYNIPADRQNLPAGLPQTSRAEGIMQGKNDFGATGYGGPCPPMGDKDHRYFFRLFALDTQLDLKPGAEKADVEAAIAGHTLAKAELIGRFGVH